jgi:hypothetical protein
MLGRGHFHWYFDLFQAKFAKPAGDGEGAILFGFDVAADEQFFFGADGGDVEQAAIFGIFEFILMAGGDLPSCGVVVAIFEVEEDVFGG